MASSTKNVKLGVCKVFLAGYDLGYTKGGVDVAVATETHKVAVDQFGKTSINEYLMGRTVTAKVPLAETTLDNMVAIMPGATLTQTGGAVAAGSITVATNPSTGETITVNGFTVTFKTVLTVPAVEGEVLIGAAAADSAKNLAAALNLMTDGRVSVAGYYYPGTGSAVTVRWGPVSVGGVPSLTSGVKSADGNSFTLATGSAAAKVTMGAAVLSGGLDATGKSVVVTSGTGVDLLSICKELPHRRLRDSSGWYCRCPAVCL